MDQKLRPSFSHSAKQIKPGRPGSPSITRLFGLSHNPKFLGVTLDRTLKFGKHVALISARSSQKKILGAVRWGWRKGDVFEVYLSHIRTTPELFWGLMATLAEPDQDQTTQEFRIAA